MTGKRLKQNNRKEKPLDRAAGTESAPTGCKQCMAPFDAATWPRSKWTLSGWSPWCAKHDKAFAPRPLPKAKPGPKPKKAGDFNNTPL